MKQDKVLSLLGLAAKAGKLASGEFCTEKEIKAGRAKLVILAEDASGNTKKKFQNMCDYYQVPIRCYNEKEVLGHAMGKELRASAAILDGGFAGSILKQLDSQESYNCIEEVSLYVKDESI